MDVSTWKSWGAKQGRGLGDSRIDKDVGDVRGWHVLVLPAASRPSISRRISREPKSLAMILDMLPPMMAVWWDLMTSAGGMLAPPQHSSSSRHTTGEYSFSRDRAVAIRHRNVRIG